MVITFLKDLFQCFHQCFRFILKLLVYGTISRLSDLLMSVVGTGEHECL